MVVAGLVTLHLAGLAAFAIPFPTKTAIDGWKRPGTNIQIDDLVRHLHRWFAPSESERGFRQKLISVMVDYAEGMTRARGLSPLYLEVIGSGQNWNMFSNVPKVAHVAVFEVKPKGAKKYRVWLDTHWGKPGNRILDFRRRKALAELVTSRGAPLRDFVAWWAKRWQKEHPGRRLAGLRFYYKEYATPTASKLLHGPRPVERRVLVYTWKPKRGGQGSVKGKEPETTKDRAVPKDQESPE